MLKISLKKLLFVSLLCVQTHTSYSFNAQKNELDNRLVGEITSIVNKEDIKFIDLDFTDLFGNLRTLTIPASTVSFAIDKGISVKPSLLQIPCDSSLRLIPILETFTVLPWTAPNKTASFICEVFDNAAEAVLASHPRTILQKLSSTIEDMGYTFNVAPEIEFYLFKEGNFACNLESLLIDQGDIGYPIYDKKIRNVIYSIVDALNVMGINPEKVHHDSAPSKYEVVIRHGNALEIADKVIMIKKAIQSIAIRNGLRACFMPKVMRNHPSCAMQINYSLWNNRENQNAFFDSTNQLHLSPLAYNFIAGNLAQAKTLTALLNPTINSYKRLNNIDNDVPVWVAWGLENRSCIIRIPFVTIDDKNAVRAEFRSSDQCANPYLAFAALLKSGIYGIENKLAPTDPTVHNFYELSPKEITNLGIQTLPETLESALEIARNNNFLRDFLGEEILAHYIKTKQQEVLAFRQVITDWEINQGMNI